MHLLILGDLHYPRESHLFNRFISNLSRENYDWILLCGDILNYGNSELLKKFLRKVHKSTSARIVAVMGNHDFWLSNNELRKKKTSWESISKYERIFNIFGDILLWEKPYVLEDLNIGIAGVPGWYDFSFANKKLGIDEEYYLKGHLHDMQWYDTVFTRFCMPPEEVTKINLKNLRTQLNRLRTYGVKDTIVLLHFIPLYNFIKVTDDLKDDFWNAYYGSAALGKEIFNFKDIVSKVFLAT